MISAHSAALHRLVSTLKRYSIFSAIQGRIIFLNGVTSSGKTSIVEAIQERDDVFFYVVANDLFQEMVGDKYLRENYWKCLSDCTDLYPLSNGTLYFLPSVHAAHPIDFHTCLRE